MRRNFILASCLVLVFVGAQTVRAEMFSFSKSMSGTISDVSPNGISLTPTNPNQNNAAPVNLEINDATKLKNLQAVTDLKRGDDIQVRYKEQDGKKIAVQVEATAAGAAAVNANAAMNPADRGDGIAEERTQINQGTNQAAANKQDTITQNDQDSSFEPIPNQGQGMPSQDRNQNTRTTRDVSIVDPAMENRGQAAPRAGQVQSTDPSAAEGTPAMQR